MTDKQTAAVFITAILAMVIIIIVPITLIKLTGEPKQEQVLPHYINAQNDALTREFIECLEDSPEHWDSYRNYMHLVTNKLFTNPNQLYHAFMFDLEHDPNFEESLRQDIQKVCNSETYI